VASRNDVPFLEAVKAALQQAIQSYAPYSHCPSGLAIATAGGAVYSGPYLESAAFNPSLGPLQAAVIDAVTDGIAYYTEVSGAVVPMLTAPEASWSTLVTMDAKSTVSDSKQCTWPVDFTFAMYKFRVG